MMDTVDIAYLFRHFLKKFEADCDREDLEVQAESESEMDLMTHMMEKAMEASASINGIIDFAECDLEGPWAYEHMGDDMSDLPHIVWKQCVASNCSTDDVVRRYAIDNGLTLKVD